MVETVRKVTWKLSRDRRKLIQTVTWELAELANQLLASDAAVGREELTKREQVALPLLVGGNTGKEIAAAMGVSERTAKFHASAIYRKFGVHRQTELMVLAGPRKIA